MYISQEGTLNDCSFSLYAINENNKIENVNDGLPEMTKEHTVNKVLVSYTASAELITSTFSVDSVEYVFIYNSTSENEFIKLLEMFLV